MEDFEALLQHLKRELEITNGCLPQCGIQEGFRKEIEIIEHALEIMEEYRAGLQEACII